MSRVYEIVTATGARLRGREGYTYRSAAWVAKHGAWLRMMGYRAVLVMA